MYDNIAWAGAILAAAYGKPKIVLGFLISGVVMRACLRPRFTSRAEQEEQWHAIKHLLHAEGHLIEMISTAPASKRAVLAQVLDDTRLRRQRLAQASMRAAGGQADSWCAIKHSLVAEGHLEEMLENAVRAGSDRQEIILQLAGVRAARVKLLDASGSTCQRCRRDLVVR